MKTLLGVYFIPQNFSLDELTLPSKGTNIRMLLTSMETLSTFKYQF